MKKKEKKTCACYDCKKLDGKCARAVLFSSKNGIEKYKCPRCGSIAEIDYTVTASVFSSKKS